MPVLPLALCVRSSGHGYLTPACLCGALCYLELLVAEFQIPLWASSTGYPVLLETDTHLYEVEIENQNQ